MAMVGRAILLVERGIRRESRLVEAGVLVDRAGQEALAERTEWHEADADSSKAGRISSSGFAPPQRILALQGGTG